MSAQLLRPTGWRLAILGGLALAIATGCGAQPISLAPAGGQAEADATFSQAPAPPSDLAAVDPAATAPLPGPPQLVKRANVSLVVGSVEDTVSAANQLARKFQGDVLSLEQGQPQPGGRRQASLTLRLPQQNLEPALAELLQLGDVQQQSLTADDVSDQLVDLAARLRNLRQSEAALLKIMDRSGKIAEVLEVARELSTVREAIERLAAQQQQLNRQVAYATVTLTLTNATAAPAELRPLPETLGASWQAANRSVGQLTVGLLRVLLWLLAYSPYLAAIALLAFGGYRLRSRPPLSQPQPPEVSD